MNHIIPRHQLDIKLPCMRFIVKGKILISGDLTIIATAETDSSQLPLHFIIASNVINIVPREQRLHGRYYSRYGRYDPSILPKRKVARITGSGTRYVTFQFLSSEGGLICKHFHYNWDDEAGNWMQNLKCYGLLPIEALLIIILGSYVIASMK